MNKNLSPLDLAAENEDLRARLAEAEETLQAIRSGEVDALVVSGPEGDKVFTLKGADYPYRVLIEEMNQGAVTLTDNGLILYANKRFANMLKTPLETLIGSEIYKYFSPTDRNIYRELLQQDGKDSGRPREVILLASDETLIPAYISINVLQIEEMQRTVCMVATDLTEQKHTEMLIALQKQTEEANKMLQTEINERKKAEEALKESESRFRGIFENAGVGMALLISLTGEFVKVNRKYSEFVGYTIEELENISFQKITYPEDIQLNKDFIDSLITGKGHEHTMEKRYIHKNGSVIWGRLTVSPLWKTGETPKYHIAIVEDITERKKAEDELKRSNEELEQFAYIASHDLQEPLRMVSSYTQLLGKRYESQLDDEAREFIKYAIDGALRMQRLIHDLLKYSRINTQGMPKELTDSHSALGKALQNIFASIEENRALITNDELPTVYADSTQLMQLFQNLIANAIKFKGAETPHVHISAKDLGHEWLFSVKDNGIGIDKKYEEKVFVIFKRLHTRKEYPGTGIGLAVCKRIVNRHGGRIWFESELNKGTTFYFTIPK